jgi:hypothetical protein
MRRAHAFVCLLAGALLAASPASAAAPPDEATRARARPIGEEGLALFDAGKYGEALERFDRADTLYRAPTHGLMAARCLAKLGRLIESSERYLGVTGMELEPGASHVFRQAKVDAARELQALLARIPTLAVDVTGAAIPGVTVTLDGKPIKDLGAPRSVNPGAHHVEALKENAVLASDDVTLAEHEERRVTLRLPAALRGDAVATTRSAAPPPERPDQTPRLAGWIALGAGGAGIALGGVTGVLAIGAQGDLDEGGCEDGVCPRRLSGDLDRYDALRVLSTVGFIAGGVGLAAGAVVLLTAPRGAPPAERAAGARVAPWIGAGAAGVRGVF